MPTFHPAKLLSAPLVPPIVVFVAVGEEDVREVVEVGVGPLVLSILATGVGVSDSTAPNKLLKLVALAGGVNVKLLDNTAKRLDASARSSAVVVYVVVV
jgi:hypothetical protein